MSPLFMDTGCELNSPGSLSADESHSNTAGSEREGEGQQVMNRGTKRQEKNRDAARKSRRKQTERADELHEELQCLERSNSALQKEIASLKRDFDLYTKALERHKPFCCLKTSTSILTTRSSPPQASSSPPLTTSLTSSLGLQTVAATTLASSSGSSAELFASSSSVNVPFSVSISAVPAPHSLFSQDPTSLVTSRSTNAAPVCTSLVSNPAPPNSLTTAAQLQSGQGAIHESSHFSALHPGALDAFLMKQTPFPSASSNVAPPYSHSAAENTGLAAQNCLMDAPQLHPGHFRGNPLTSMISPCSFLPSILQDPAPQSLSPSRQANPETPLSASNPNYRHISPNHASLLSLLTVPGPLNAPETTSSCFDGPLSQPPHSLPPLGDPLRDFSLSELLDVNDWILQ